MIYTGSGSSYAGEYQSDIQRYYPYGATRGSYEVETAYRYTGQRQESDLGLYFYRAQVVGVGSGQRLRRFDSEASNRP